PASRGGGDRGSGRVRRGAGDQSDQELGALGTVGGPQGEAAMTPSPRWLSRRVLALVVAPLTAGPASSQPTPRGHGAEAHDMELVGHDELQGRSAYQPTIHKQRG